MTLELRLKSIETTKGTKPSFVYVDGGQSGALRLNASKLPQQIKCSNKDHLQFIMCGHDSGVYPQQKDVLARRDFWAQSTVDQNRQVWDDEKQHQYKFEYFNQKHEKLGALVFDVKYLRGLYYQGQLIGADKIARRLLPFYKSRCPTFNLYNCLDSRDGKDAYFNAIQDIYRDQN